MITVAERFWGKVSKTPDCWIWIGALDRDGYGQFQQQRAHRFAYEATVGPIQDGLTIDHLCKVRNCVNPAHMEAVPFRVNLMRGDSPSSLNARKTHCIRGHSLADAYLRRGRRICRPCRKEQQRQASRR